MGSSKVNPQVDQSPSKGSSLPLPATTKYKQFAPSSFTCIRINRCCLLGTIFLLLVAMSVTVLCLVAFQLNPQPATYILGNVQFTMLNITNASFTEDNSTDPSQITKLGYSMIMSVEAFNPNKKISIFYQSIRMAVSFEETILGERTVAKQVYQGHKNETMLHISIQAEDVMLTESAASGLKQAIAKSVIPLQIEVEMHVRVIVQGLWRKYIRSGDKCTVEREGADKPWELKGKYCVWKEYNYKSGVEVSPPLAKGGSRLLSRDGCSWEADLYAN